MRYREASREDAAAIADLHAESWRDGAQGQVISDDFVTGPLYDDRRAVWVERMSSPPPNQYVILAEEDAELVGFACAYGADDQRWGTLLDNLHVRSDRRGDGVGQRLLVAIVEWCCVNYPNAGLYLWVLERNVRARRLYERLGAADEGGDVWHAPGGGSAPCRRYAWTSEGMAAIPSLARTRIAEA
ncbi:MAG: GNAT family N-acetyltransferase [Dehalococcoidia bacterium]